MTDRERHQLVSIRHCPIVDLPGVVVVSSGTMDPILPQPKLLSSFGRPRASLVGDVVRHAGERVNGRDVRPHRRRQQVRRDREIFVVRPRERLARRIRAR
jgi:hypothetical protein